MRTTFIPIQQLLAAYAATAARSNTAIAIKALIETLRSENCMVGRWLDAATGLLQSDAHAQAAVVLDAAIDLFGSTADLYYLHGVARRLDARNEEAELDFRTALQIAPAHREAALALAHLLREQGRIDASADVIVSLWHCHAGDAALTRSALAFLRDCSAHAQASEIARSAALRWPDDAGIAACAGEIALALGDFDTAATSLRRAVTLDPEQSAAWLRLSYCQRYRDPADDDRARIQTAWNNPQRSTQTRICAGFALGKLLDDVGAFGDAAVTLRAANALAKSQTPWSEQIWRDFVERQIHLPPLPVLSANPQFVPVFIVGMPRTGTTLVATLLDRHTQIRDRGELNWIDAMHAHLQAQGALHNPAALREVAALVSAQMRRDDIPARCYIDKNPLNFRYLNLVAALFPNARIIHCRRNPRDTALSIWSQHFAHDDLRFSYDFSAIRNFSKGYQSLIEHWRSTLPLKLIEVDYATLVAEEAHELQRLHTFLDLADLQPSASTAPARAVTTASVWQARQPVYTHAVGRWRNYAEYLPELVELFDA